LYDIAIACKFGEAEEWVPAFAGTTTEHLLFLSEYLPSLPLRNTS
jgi:hypothetical protein